MKGCIDSLKAWTGTEITELQRSELFNYLNPLVLDAHHGMGTSFTISYLDPLVNHFSQHLQQCKRVTNTLSIIGSNQDKVKEAVSLLGMVDEYMNMCNRFAATYQMKHNIGEDINHPMWASHDHGFDFASQLFQHFAGYFSTLEMRSTSAVG